MSDAADREAAIFGEALIVPEAERDRYLRTACGEDEAMRQRIAALLAAHDSAGRFMAANAGPSGRDDRAGSRIGRYKLLQQLGEGGCGVVWMAEQEEPVRRRVAVKVIKLGMDTKAVIARFEAERQALALMDHPGIARVLDAGATESGRPYFVMELVAGVPITRFCDERNLPPAARLALFAQVCQAVQHAHAKGIIHRDLKPSNILVTLHDGEPAPKVIDFGIAKATQGRLTDQTLFTAFEQFLGTPAYMSPEQAELSSVDVDTRSDIYALGVLLYELLTGRPPFDPKTLVQAGLDEVRRIIREVEPVKPSTRLNTLADADRATVARQRGTAPAQLSLLLRGDLDWIVMKALEKNRNRRYDTASSLAEDIQRHLQNEPVSARPPTAGYRLSRFVRRHRLLFYSASAVAAALVVGIVVSATQAIRARRAERQAEQARAQAEDLLGFMLGDLRSGLAKVGRLDVLESVGDKAMGYFAAERPGGLDDATLARYAKALIQIGEIRMDQNRPADALASFDEAYRRAVELVGRHPTDGALIFQRGQAEYWKGFVAWKRGDRDEAATWLGRYHDTCVALAAANPTRADWQGELAYGNHNLAVLAKERGDYAAARADFLAELATLEQMSAAAPADLDLRYRIADAHSWLGGIATEQGHFAEGLEHYGKQAAALENLVLAEPRTAKWKYRLADTRLFQVDVLLATGRGAEAREELGRAMAALAELVALDPGNRHWEGEQQHGRLLGAALARRDGNAAGAEELLREAAPRLQALSAADPTDRLLARWSAQALRLEAALDFASGRPGALERVARAAEAGEKLARDGRANAGDVGECAQALVLQGEITARAGDAAAARHEWEQAAELLAPRLAGADDWRLLDPAARAALHLGHAEAARDLIGRLEHAGYVPLEPWPEPNPLDASESSGTKQ